MKRIALLGSTGSIGTQTLDIVRRLPDRLGIVALAAGSNAEILGDQALEFGVPVVALVDGAHRAELDSRLPRQTTIVTGEEALEAIVLREEVDIVVVAVAGAIGSRATMAALLAGKTVALATKEVLVAAGEVVMSAATMGGGTIVPIDSEHSGLMQCMAGNRREDVYNLWLTTSGGPFRTWSREQMEKATVADALKHPTWRMGAKISVDSATLMNKGLELIEAHWLFDHVTQHIDLVVHPQSIVHALVEMSDGSVLAQLGLPDMRLPIEYALLEPERVECGLPRLDVRQMGSLVFEPVDEDRFPCPRLAREAIEIGGTMPAVLNAANEAAVSLFLSGRLPFLGIADTIESTMRSHVAQFKPSIDQILYADAWARRFVVETRT